MSWLLRRKTGRISRAAQNMVRAGHAEGAVKRFQRALELDPDNAFLHVHLALAQVETGEDDAARASAQRALDLAPDRAGVRLLAGRVYYEVDDFAAAREAFDAVLVANPDNDLAHAYRVLTDWAAGDTEAWQRLTPQDLPDSNPFLVRWLERVEAELRPAPHVDAAPVLRKPPFRPHVRPRRTVPPETPGDRRCD